MALDGISPEEIQAAIARASAEWEAGPTPLTDLPVEEQRLRLGYVPGPNEPSLAEREQAAALRQLAASIAPVGPEAEALPASYDLRNVGGRNFITPVRDQGNCGSCVAFGTVAAVEGTLRVALDDPTLDVDYSEAHLFYCHARSEGRLCGPGWMAGWWVDRALEAFKSRGVVDEGCYPYVAGDQNCTGLCSTAPARLTFIDSWRRFVTSASMKTWLTSSGPLITCLSVHQDFVAYRSGVYRHVTGDWLGGHCVCVVGYDDAQGCWICKNSWGTGWGESGFFRIAYGNVGIDAEMWTVEGVRGPAIREAVFVSQTTPAAIVPGQRYDVTVTMRNVGVQTWTPDRSYRLGSQNPQDNSTWGLARVPAPGRVAPWQDATFRFQVTAPPAPAHLQWRMLQEAVEWFGEYTADVVLAAAGTPVRYGTTLKTRHLMTGRALRSYPASYGHPGSSGQQQVTCNAGADDYDLWRVKGPDGQPDGFRLGQQVQHGEVIRLQHVLTARNLHSHAGFPSPVTGQQEITCYGVGGVGDGNDDWRVEVTGGGPWEAGKQVRLIHVLTNHALHSHAGYSHPQWTMGQQEVTGYADRDGNDLWFATDFLTRDARFVSQSVPTSMIAGQGYDVAVTMRNLGAQAWTPGQHRLGSQSPQDNRTWGPTRIDLPGPIAPAQEVTLSFHITAPTTTGPAHFQWRMLHEGVGPFGDYTPHVGVNIYAAAGPTTVPDVVGEVRTNAAALIRAADLVPAFTGATGTATEVSSQSPPAGSTVNRGSTVTLRMTSLA